MTSPVVPGENSPLSTPDAPVKIRLWEYPANYSKIQLEEERGGQPVWQVVKRPLSKDEMDRLHDEAKKKQAKRVAELQAEKLAAGVDAEEAAIVEEDEEVYVPEKFHYYWRLSAPNAYEKAGAVGSHWRPILLSTEGSGQNMKIKPEKLGVLETKGRLYWLKEARLQQKLTEGTLGGTQSRLLIFDKEFNETALSVNEIKIINEEAGTPREGKKYVITFDQFLHLIKKWSANLDLVGRALRASTPTDLVAAQPQGGMQEEDTIPFRYPSGAFVDSNKSLELAPTTWRNPERVRLYVKLRSVRAGFDSAGGIDDFTVDDIFIAKEVLEKMSGAAFELDPTRAQLESNVWPADERDSKGKKTGEGAMEEEKDNETEKRLAKKKNGKKDMSMTEEKDDATGKDKGDLKVEEEEGKLAVEEKDLFATAAFGDNTIWARNSMGFAFQYKYKPNSTRSSKNANNKVPELQVLWDTVRREAIRSLEREGGWTRYIDPAIPLYIVPTSLEETNNMHVEVLQAMKDLDMHSTAIHVDEVCKRKGDNVKLPKLRPAGAAAADCATTKIYLVTREALKKISEDDQTPMKHLALSPFRHYETWITKSDWDAYIRSRPKRTEMRWALNEKQIETARKKLRPKADKVVKLEEEVRKATGTVRTMIEGELATKQLEAKQTQKNEVIAWQALSVEVSDTKILRAIGKRAGAKSQASIMGGSATLVSDNPAILDFGMADNDGNQVAKHLGWDKADQKTPGDMGNWPSTSHMPAEWLHRIAFSWGGIDGKECVMSSQDKKNLIFGSGECNSVMTRYEKAWQAMVLKEGHRLKPTSMEGAEAALLKKNGKDGAGYIYTWTERDEYRSEYGFNYADNGWGKEVDLVKQPMTKEDQEAHLPPWLTYSLKYKLVQKSDVLPLGEGMKSFETFFYPWQRGFFTKFEQKLDEIILESTYTAYHAKNKDSVTAKVDQGHNQAQTGQPAVLVVPEGMFQGLTGSDVHEQQTLSDGDHDVAARELLKGEDEDMGPSKKLKGNGKKHSSRVDLEEPLNIQPDDFFAIAAAPMMNLANRVRVTKIVEASDDTEALDPTVAQSNLDEPEAAPEVQAVWEQVHAPGPTFIDGLLFANAEIVGGGSASNAEKTGVDDGVTLGSAAQGSSLTDSDSTNETVPALDVVFDSLATSILKPHSKPAQPPITPVPERFVVKAKFKLFNRFHADIYSLHDSHCPRVQHYRVNLPKELSLGALLPSQAGSDLDAIALRNTSLEYRSHGTATGLRIATEITLSGLLQPVSALLRDVFGQDRPRINVSGVISSSMTLVRPPEPLGFTLRGELPEVNVPDLFGVLTVTHIGLDVMGSRRGSAGGYDLSYAFFGRGRVDAATAVEWRVERLGELWKIAVQAESGEWKNVAGVDGVHVCCPFSWLTCLMANHPHR